MELQITSEIDKAAGYVKDVLDWAVVKFGEQVLLVAEKPDKFKELAEKYNAEYTEFVQKVLALKPGLKASLIHKVATHVYAENRKPKQWAIIGEEHGSVSGKMTQTQNLPKEVRPDGIPAVTHLDVYRFAESNGLSYHKPLK